MFNTSKWPLGWVEVLVLWLAAAGALTVFAGVIGGVWWLVQHMTWVWR